MQSKKRIQIAQLIAERAADFFAHESNYRSLITVTRAELSPDLKSVMVLFTVLPESAEQAVLDFAKRSRGEFRQVLMQKTRLGRIPSVDFDIDYGEKNRQRIDTLTRQ